MANALVRFFRPRVLALLVCAAAGWLSLAGLTGFFSATGAGRAAGLFEPNDRHELRAAATAEFQPVTPQNMVFVTATSSNHFCVALDAVASIQKHHPLSRIVLYDLGLAPAESLQLARLPYVTLRQFDYGRYPDYFNVTRAAGHYAWKPAIVGEVMAEPAVDVVVWVDSGDELLKPLDPLLQFVWSSGGLYSGVSHGNVTTWTHPGMLAYFGINGTSHPILYKPNCNAAFMILFTSLTFHQFVVPWRACALDRNCIAPKGSSRANHRQDQAALTVLVRLNNDRFRTCEQGTPVDSAYKIHRDSWRNNTCLKT